MFFRGLFAAALLSVSVASSERHQQIWPTKSRVAQNTVTTFPNYYETTEWTTLPVTITKSSLISTSETEIFSPVITVTSVNVVDFTNTQTVHLPVQTLRVERVTKTTSLSRLSTIVTQTAVQPSPLMQQTTLFKSVTMFRPETQYLTLTPTFLQTRIKPTPTEVTLQVTVTKTDISKSSYTRTSTPGYPFTSISADITVTATSTKVDVEYATKNITLTSTTTLALPIRTTTTVDVTRTVTRFVPQTDFYPVNITVTDWVVDKNGMAPEYYTRTLTPTLLAREFHGQDSVVFTTYTATDTQVKPETLQRTVSMYVTETAVAVATTSAAVLETETVVVTSTL